MNVQWMRTKARHSWMNSIRDDVCNVLDVMLVMMMVMHSYDILGARMLWKPKEARILKKFIDQPV